MDLIEKLKGLELCIDCQGPILYYDTKITRVGKIVGKHANTTKKTGHKLKVCEKCLSTKFPVWHNKNKSRVFNMMCDITKYAFQIDDETYNTQKRSLVVRSKENFIKKYGEKIGIEKWNTYCKKQAETNSYEYKKEKYGFTQEDFKRYNKKRAVTKNNLIEKYGEDVGNVKWIEYLEKQKLTKSWDYMASKYGTSKAKQINQNKALTLNNFIKKYGKVLGTSKYEEFISKKKPNFSKASQVFFKKLDHHFSKKFTTYYATKNCEYGVNLGDQYIMIDYYILEKNIAIEYKGTFWHADPRIYSENDIVIGDACASSIWYNDKLREEKLLNIRGIKTITVWQLDNVDEEINKILKIIENEEF